MKGKESAATRFQMGLPSRCVLTEVSLRSRNFTHLNVNGKDLVEGVYIYIYALMFEIDLVSRVASRYSMFEQNSSQFLFEKEDMDRFFVNI